MINKDIQKSYLCFFFTSVNIEIFCAPIDLRYLSSFPAQASIYPSSATCPKTKPSALINWKSDACATAIASSFAAANI